MFSLAKELGMTVSQLSKELTLEEVIGWSGYFSLKAEEEDKERDRVQKSSAARTHSS